MVTPFGEELSSLDPVQSFATFLSEFQSMLGGVCMVAVASQD